MRQRAHLGLRAVGPPVAALLAAGVLGLAAGVSELCREPSAAQAADATPVVRLRSAFADEPDLAADPALRPLPVPWRGVLAALVPGGVDPAAAPIPRTDAERLAFGHLYESPTRVAQDGRVLPGLADAWTSQEQGRTWILTLREGARFWNGERVTAADVAASWIAVSGRTAGGPSALGPLAWLGLTARALRPLDERTLAVDLPEAMPDFPAVLAHPALAVRGRTPAGQAWPLGSGPCRPAEPAAAPGDSLALVPHAGHPRAPSWSRLTLLLDAAGASAWDLALGRDELSDADAAGARAAADAAAGPAAALALPWDRLYYLVCPPQEVGATTFEQRWRWTADAAAGAFVAQTATARGAASLPASLQPARTWTFYVDADPMCPLLRQPAPPPEPAAMDRADRTAAADADLIVYPEDDPAAARLAARLAEHAARPLRPGPDSVARGPLTPPDHPVAGLAPQDLGLRADRFEAALRSGRAGAYVLPVERRDGSDCRQLAGILGRALWLQEAAADDRYSDRSLPEGARAADPVADRDPVADAAVRSALRLQRAGVLVPLAAGRAILRVRTGLQGIAVDFDGVPDLCGAGYPPRTLRGIGG